VLAAALPGHIGFGFARYPAGLIASVLLLVPGFPLIAGLFDLLRYQTVAAVTRLAYGAMILLAVALGLSIVIAVAGVDLSRQPPLELAYPLKLLLRAARALSQPARSQCCSTAPHVRYWVFWRWERTHDVGMMLARRHFLPLWPSDSWPC
jgi:Putative threonine/serine exporter